jgi:hypothetical protein
MTDDGTEGGRSDGLPDAGLSDEERLSGCLTFGWGGAVGMR